MCCVLLNGIFMNKGKHTPSPSQEGKTILSYSVNGVQANSGPFAKNTHRVLFYAWPYLNLPEGMAERGACFVYDKKSYIYTLTYNISCIIQKTYQSIVF